MAVIFGKHQYSQHCTTKLYCAQPFHVKMPACVVPDVQMCFISIGKGFGLGGSTVSGPSFIPSYMDSYQNNFLNYFFGQDTSTRPPGTTTAVEEKQLSTGNVDNVTQQLDAGSAVSAKSTDPPSTKQTLFDIHVTQRVPTSFVSDIQDSANKSSQNIFMNLPSYSGTPGMLGVGSQLPAGVVNQQIIDVPEAQYLPPGIRNTTEVNANYPVYSGFPGMIGEGQQVVQQVPPQQQYIYSNRTLQYITQFSPDIRTDGGKGVNSTDKSENSSTGDSGNVTAQPNLGYSSHQEVPEVYMSSVPGSLGLEMVPEGVNTNNWKGEWPGITCFMSGL